MECGYREKNIKISVAKYVTGEAPYKILIELLLYTGVCEGLEIEERMKRHNPCPVCMEFLLS